MLERRRILPTQKENDLFHDQLRCSASLVRVKSQGQTLRETLKVKLVQKGRRKFSAKSTEVRFKMNPVKIIDKLHIYAHVCMCMYRLPNLTKVFRIVLEFSS